MRRRREREREKICVCGFVQGQRKKRAIEKKERKKKRNKMKNETKTERMLEESPAFFLTTESSTAGAISMPSSSPARFTSVSWLLSFAATSAVLLSLEKRETDQ